MSKIKSLNPLAFTKLVSNRNEKIESVKPEKLKDIHTYKANKLAEELHPHVQVLKVKEIIEETEDTKSYVLERIDGKCAYFAAGQYLTIAIEIEGKYYSRPYSISSSPKRSLENEYQITIKATEGGLVSNYILDNYQLGDTLIASAPIGNFTYEPLRDSKHIVGIAGGSGIAPFMSLAQAIADQEEECDLTLLYGFRNLKDGIFYEKLKKLARECDHLKVIPVISDEKSEGMESGYINLDILNKYAPKEEYSLFICGPKSLHTFIDKEIEPLHLRKKFVRHEMFGEYHHPEKQSDFIKAEKQEYNLTVKMNGQEYHVVAKSEVSLLVSMEQNGIFAPSDCRSGVCGWCHSQLLEGKVYIPKYSDYRRAADKKFGYIHPCVAFPLSDIVLEVPAVPMG